MEIVDSRLESLKFLVHIFRVVDVRMTLRGKPGWAVHYNVVEGIKKKKQGACRKLLKVHGRERLKRKRACGSSHSKLSNLANSVVETSCKRLTRRGRSQAALRSSEEISTSALHRSEHDNEDTLPLEHARDSNDEDLTPSETDNYNKFDKTLPKDVKIELMEVKMEYANESNDGGLITLKIVEDLPRKVEIETKL